MIGTLNQRLTLQRKLQIADEAGGFAESWETVATVWASVRTTDAREGVQADQIVAERSLAVRIRHRSDVTAAWQGLLAGRVLAIVSVSDPDGRRRWLDLACIEERAS